MEDTQKAFYSNNIAVFSGSNDFIIKFQMNVPKIDKNEKVSNAVANEVDIAISPRLFKSFAEVVQNRLKAYETEHGEIIISKKKSSKTKR